MVRGIIEDGIKVVRNSGGELYSACARSPHRVLYVPGEWIRVPKGNIGLMTFALDTEPKWLARFAEGCEVWDCKILNPRRPNWLPHVDGIEEMCSAMDELIKGLTPAEVVVRFRFLEAEKLFCGYGAVCLVPQGTICSDAVKRIKRRE